MAAPKLAIDFGTSRTKVAYYDESAGKPQLIQLGEDIRTVLPSIFYIPKEGQGERLVGDEAKKMADSDPEGIVLSLKKEIHKMGKKRCGPDRPAIDRIQLAADLFRYIHKRCRTEVFHDEDLFACRLTVPADFKAQQREAIKSAAQLGGFREVAIVEEPVAAAQAWLWNHAGEKFGSNVVVCDVGGGTTDFAFLKFTEGRFETDEKVLSDGFQQGGNDVDELIWEKLCENNSANEEMQNFRAGFILKICQGRELISRTKKSETSISVNGYQFVLSQTITEEATAEFVERVKVETQRFLEKLRNQAKAENAPILLVGGASKLQGLSDALRSLKAGDIYLWSDSDYATALGAVEIPTALVVKPASHDKTRIFAEAVKMAAADGKITPDEVLRLKLLMQELGLSDQSVSEVAGKCLGKGKDALIQALNAKIKTPMLPQVSSSAEESASDHGHQVTFRSHEYNKNGFCVYCGFERGFIEKTLRACRSSQNQMKIDEKKETDEAKQYDSQHTLLGTYTGKCTNNTHKPSIEAEIVLVFKHLHGNKVVGDLSIIGNLTGGSVFAGRLDGDRIFFTTRVNDSIQIIWSGYIIGNIIRGGYKSGRNLAPKGILDLLLWPALSTMDYIDGPQEGEWICKKVGCQII